MTIDDFKPGMSIRFTAEWRAAMKTAGISAAYIERRSHGVVTVVETTAHWDSVTYRISDGSVHTAYPDNLEPDLEVKQP